MADGEKWGPVFKDFRDETRKNVEEIKKYVDTIQKNIESSQYLKRKDWEGMEHKRTEEIKGINTSLENIKNSLQQYGNLKQEYDIFKNELQKKYEERFVEIEGKIAQTQENQKKIDTWFTDIKREKAEKLKEKRATRGFKEIEIKYATETNVKNLENKVNGNAEEAREEFNAFTKEIEELKKPKRILKPISEGDLK